MAIKKVKAFKILSDVEKACRFNRFDNPSICGSCVAKNVNGKLVYVSNDSAANKKKIEAVDDIRYNLHKYCLVAKSLLEPEEYQLTSLDMAKIKKSVSKIKDYCLKNGFYGKALDCAKLLKRNFHTDELETVEQVVKGYAKRQLLSGDDQRSKIRGITKDIYMFKKYGRNAKNKPKNYFWDLFNNEKVTIRGKEFGTSDYMDAIKTI